MQFTQCCLRRHCKQQKLTFVYYKKGIYALAHLNLSTAVFKCIRYCRYCYSYSSVKFSSVHLLKVTYINVAKVKVK